MGELTPVVMVDGRPIGYLHTDKAAVPAVAAAIARGDVEPSCPWPVTRLLQGMYRALTNTEGLPIP